MSEDQTAKELKSNVRVVTVLLFVMAGILAPFALCGQSLLITLLWGALVLVALTVYLVGRFL